MKSMKLHGESKSESKSQSNYNISDSEMLGPGEGLTSWMYIQLKWSRSIESLENDSLPGWMFTHLINDSDLLKHWRVTHSLHGCSTHSHQWF